VTVFILDARLSKAPPAARDFLDVVGDDLELANVCRLTDEGAAYGASFAYGDGFIFANPISSQGLSEAADAALGEARQAGAVILPIATTADSRRPPDGIEQAQSFDVVDAARQRGMPTNAYRTVAHAFSRQALARLAPTMASDRVRLFLCHRRSDGEDLVAAVDRVLSATHQRFFRDLVNIQVGEVAQEKIDEALATADVLVFFDTPAAGESAWVAHELATALGRGIPVVWVRVDDAAERAALPVQPGGAPQITDVDADATISDQDALQSLAEQILVEADELNRAHVRRARETFSRIRRQARELGREVQTLDARLQIFSTKQEATGGRYPTRPAIHVLQVFARHPRTEDQKQLIDWLSEHDYGPHQADCRAFDAAVMLDPLPGASTRFSEFGVVEPARDYLKSLEQPTNTRGSSHDGTLLLLGAFPTAVSTHAAVIEAVQATTGTWLDLGGRIVCGGHPTFVPLLTEALRLRGLPSDRLVVFWSRYYVKDENIAALRTQATVVPIQAVAGDKSASLTAMRQAMVAGAGHAAVIAVGGRTHELGQHVPGLNEEIKLARGAGLPVYIMGAAGGQASVLAADAGASGWGSLGNRLSPADNEFVATSDRYEDIAELIWSQ
jgi:SLOG cluster2/TIR domain